ncbi:hypothetical protein PVAP13_3KG267100 [Panicum virgatum]|nr:hypothetical protein PVAP13_3KG267100 [Panicum virgatum]
MSGWEDFVKAHELQENDLLLFTCCGNSSFQVLVFEASGCERVSSMFGNQIGPDMCKHVKNIVGQHGEPDAPNTSNFIVNYSANSDDGSDDDFANSNCYYSMFANRLRDEEKEEIIGLASIQRNNPAFVTVLKKQHVQRNNNSLIIPCRFAADHLEERSQDIILRRPNRKDKWLVSYYYSCYTRCFQNLPFFKFVRDNKLREGDICVFELLKGKMRVTMTVHVIRKASDRFILVG